MFRFLICLCFLLVSACQYMPKKIVAKDAPELPSEFSIQKERASSAKDPTTVQFEQSEYAQIPVDWWRVFNDENLTELINTALDKNIDIARSTIQLKKAKLGVQRSRDTRQPQFSIGVSASARKALPYNQQSPVSNEVSKSFGTSLGVSYELDLFKKLSLAEDSAKWQAQASVEDSRAVKIVQTTQVALNYWQMAYINEQIDLAQEAVSHSEKMLNITDVRYRAGVVALMDVISAKNNVLNAQLQVNALQENRKKVRNTLALLLTRLPNSKQFFEEPKKLPEFNQRLIPQNIKPSILYNRPDIASAQWRVKSALADVSIARKAFYPNFSINAGLGTGSNEWVNILKNPVASLALSPVLPFLNRYKNKITYKTTKLDYDNAVLDFTKQLYMALNEVEDTLSGQMTLSHKHTQLNKQLEFANKILKMRRVRYLSGEEGLQNWLNAQQSYLQSKRAILDNNYEQYRNFIKLFVALGGKSS